MRHGKTQHPALWQDLRPQAPQLHSMPQIWCQPLDVPCSSQSTRTQGAGGQARIFGSDLHFFSTEFIEISEIEGLRFCAELPFASSLVPSWSHRHWEEFEEVTSLHQERWPRWTWPTTQFQWLKIYSMDDLCFSIFHHFPCHQHIFFAVLRLILILRPEGEANPGAFCRPKISNAVAAKVYWTTHIKPSICVMASGHSRSFPSWPTYLQLKTIRNGAFKVRLKWLKHGTGCKRYQVGLGPRPAKCLPGTDKNVSCRMSLPSAGFLGHQAMQRLHLPKRNLQSRVENFDEELELRTV